MKIFFRIGLFPKWISALLILFSFFLMEVKAQNFSSSVLQNTVIANPTSLQFGPDGKLYVAQQNGIIKIFTINKSGPNSYETSATETINLVKEIPNHNDDGMLNASVNSRQVTGLLVAGTSGNPVIYVVSSDSRMGAGSTGDVNLCTNSGIISKLTKNGSLWEKMDLVRGIPRSEENHAPNGLQIDAAANKLFVAVGGFTNAGSPSKMFTYSCEYALSAAILSIDLNAVEALPVTMDGTGNHPYKYDLPTLDDPTRANTMDGTDVNDPWGGNDGLNQAKVIAGGPVQVYAAGFRNPYDILITTTPGREGRMYTIDNGANASWGGYPENEGTDGTVTNEYLSAEPGSVGPGTNDPQVNNLDGLEFIGNIDTYTEGSFYGGHPNPIRANPAGAGLYTHDGPIDAGTAVWRTSISDPDYPLSADWPPVPLSMAHPAQGDFRNPGETDAALITFNTSTNGLCEYKASNFGMQGDLLAVGYKFNGCIYRVRLNASGDGVLNSIGAKKLNQDTVFASGINKPLDITSQGDDDPFPGTIWVTSYGGQSIVVYEPQELTPISTYIKTSFGVLVYPNPAYDRLIIRSESAKEHFLTIDMYDNVGKEVFRKQLKLNAVIYEECLDISSLPPGSYQLTVKSGNEKKAEVLKLVKY